MRIAFCYPPFTKGGRFPNLPQNRQFIYTASKAVKIYPVVMAQAATWLKNLAHEILWLDGVSRRLDWQRFEVKLGNFRPEIIILETKAPIMKKLWGYVNQLKAKDKKLKIVLVGDHVSYFPEESFKNSLVDFVLTGGDYDFLLINLVNSLQTPDSILQISKLEPGIYYRKKMGDGKWEIKNTGKFLLNHDLDEVPIIDRGLTRWQDYGEAYLYHPCAYVMFGRGCGISLEKTAACTFCIWQHAFWRCSARLVSPEKAIKEVKNLVKLGVKEIFDDTESSALWDDQWLKEFSRLLKKERLVGKINFSANARADQLDRKTCQLLKKIGYRLLKIGLESGNNATLTRINKKETIEQIIEGVKNAKDVGLRVMLTVMVGYPWETESEVKKTYGVAQKLMFYKTRAGDCLQASVIIPYPGTPLWRQARKNGWLKVGAYDYEKYDMSKPAMKSKIASQYWCDKIWSIQRSPLFILKSGLTIKNFSEMILLLRGAKSLLGHLKDYG